MDNIEIYFESIWQVYEQILEWKKEIANRPEPFGKKLINIFSISLLILFILSLIPIIPSLLVFLGNRFSWIIFNYNLSQATIWTYLLTWLITSVSTVALFLLCLWVDSFFKPPINKEKIHPPHTLSSEQITFIFAYQAYKELKIFFVSHMDNHIEKTLSSLRELHRFTIYDDDDIERHFNLDGDESKLESDYFVQTELVSYQLAHSIRMRGKSRSSLSRQISIAQDFLRTFEKYTWFFMDETTKKRLQALISFQKKIVVRLKKREDLPAVLSVLDNFSKFLYAFLPEHQANLNSGELKALQGEGTICLDKFVAEVDRLIDYPVEPRQGEVEHSIKKLSFLQKIQIQYCNNVFFRFFTWLLLLLVITSSLVYVVSIKISNLDVNIMVSMVIATSVTGATALAVISENSPKEMHEFKNRGIQKLRERIQINDPD